MGETYESEALKKYATLKSYNSIENLERQLYHFGATPIQIFNKHHKARPSKHEMLTEKIIGDQRSNAMIFDIINLQDPKEEILGFNFYNNFKGIKILTSKKLLT